MALSLKIYDPSRTQDWTFSQRGERTARASEEGWIVIERKGDFGRQSVVDSAGLVSLVSMICQAQGAESLLLGVGRLAAVRPEFLNPPLTWEIAWREKRAFIYRVPRQALGSLGRFYDKVSLHGQEWFFWWGPIAHMQVLVEFLRDANPAALRRAAAEGATLFLDVELGSMFGILPRGPSTEDLIQSLVAQGIAHYAGS